MKVIEFPKEDKTPPTEQVKKFLQNLIERIDSGDYQPDALVCVVISENGLVPLAVNVTALMALGYLDVAKVGIIQGLTE